MCDRLVRTHIGVGRGSNPDKASVGIIFLLPVQIVHSNHDGTGSRELGHRRHTFVRMREGLFSRVIRQDKEELPSSTAEASR